MPRLVVKVPAAPVDLARWARVVPLLLERCRTLDFDPDGVVRLPAGRREGLRVVAGEPGHVGATYQVVTWEPVVDPAGGEVRRTVASEPAFVTVEQDDGLALRLAVRVPMETAAVDASAATPRAAGPQSYAAATLTVPVPASPTQAQADVSMPMPDLPRWLGQHLDLQGVLDLSDATRPVLVAGGQLRQATGSARLEHVGRTLRAELSVTPRGLLAFAGLVWPFVARRARQTVAEAMSQWWATVVDTLDPAAPLDAVADELMADLGRDLVDRVPA